MVADGEGYGRREELVGWLESRKRDERGEIKEK